MNRDESCIQILYIPINVERIKHLYHHHPVRVCLMNPLTNACSMMTYSIDRAWCWCDGVGLSQILEKEKAPGTCNQAPSSTGPCADEVMLSTTSSNGRSTTSSSLRTGGGEKRADGWTGSPVGPGGGGDQKHGVLICSLKSLLT